MDYQSITAMIIGVVLILSILFLVFYCVKGYNLMVGFFLMAVFWTVLGVVGHSIIGNHAEFGNDYFIGKNTFEGILVSLKHVFQDGPQGYGASILTNIFFGAFFGRILIETNIASTIIKKTVELGGDQPRVTLGLLSVVTSVLFVNMTGIGPVMAIAVIVLPILLTIGIPAGVALFSFMGSVMAGILVNPVNFSQYHGILVNAAKNALGETSQTYLALDGFTYGNYAIFGWIGLAIIVVGVILVSNIALGFKKKTYAWAVDTPDQAGQSSDTNAPWYSWFAVLIPVVLITVVNMLKYENLLGELVNYTGFSTILAFLLASVYALITTGNLRGGYKKVVGRISKFFADGAMDVAPMIGFLLALAMFNNAAGLNVPYLKSVLGQIIPTNAIGLTFLFGFGAVFSFFRGPTNLVGSGAAFATIVFVGLGDSTAIALSIPFIYALFSVSTIVPQHLDMTQSWVAWGFGYTNVSPKDFMKMSIPTGYILSIILVFLAFFMYGL
ncbi:MAG: citrate transporter [Candidatus Phytoplasma sp.]|nr:citrate transporter [Phytoplasma sp.]